MVSDLDGKKVFITRFIRPQQPPDGLIADTNLPAQQVMVCEIQIFSTFIFSALIFTTLLILQNFENCPTFLQSEDVSLVTFLSK